MATGRALAVVWPHRDCTKGGPGREYCGCAEISISAARSPFGAGRGAAADATWRFRGVGSRHRRGCHVDWAHSCGVGLQTSLSRSYAADVSMNACRLAGTATRRASTICSSPAVRAEAGRWRGPCKPRWGRVETTSSGTGCPSGAGRWPIPTTEASRSTTARTPSTTTGGPTGGSSAPTATSTGAGP